MEEFVACFAEVVDPRQDSARHDLHELLFIALCTILTGGKDCSAMALLGELKEPFLRRFPLDRVTGKSPLHMVHAWSVNQRLFGWD